jgi:DNA-binding transcriptional MerR regulator
MFSMFRIGEFSRFSRVSVKMLRHYDELGLLPPARVDAQTNYRYYSADQLPRLHRIVALKDLGFSLEQIGVMLDGDPSTEQLTGMLKLRRAELQKQVRDARLQLAQT